MKEFSRLAFAVALAVVCICGVALASTNSSNRAQVQDVMGRDSSVGDHLASGASTRKPPRYVICNKEEVWVPLDYDGCMIQFSERVKAVLRFSMHGALGLLEDQWVAIKGRPTVGEMKCRRGGKVGGMLVPIGVKGGFCRWTETFGHGPFDDHPYHQWSCKILVIAYFSPSNEFKTFKGRRWMKFTLEDAPGIESGLEPDHGEYPACAKYNMGIEGDFWSYDGAPA